jgi:branched-subunit amino acid transport protein
VTTEHGSATLWVILIAAGIGTFALRLSFILLLGRLDTVPPQVVGVLRSVPAAVLAALVVPAIIVLTVTPTVGIDADPAKLLAGGLAAGVAWRTKNVLATISVGMVALWGLQLVF